MTHNLYSDHLNPGKFDKEAAQVFLSGGNIIAIGKR